MEKKIKFYQFHTTWQECDRTVIILVEDDIERGTVIVDYGGNDHKNAYLWNLTVADAYRRGGVGRQLLDAAISDAKHRRCKEIYLEWNPLDSPGWVFDWYARQGFKVTESYARGRNVRMEKKIK